MILQSGGEGNQRPGGQEINSRSTLYTPDMQQNTGLFLFFKPTLSLLALLSDPGTRVGFLAL